jgi:hypothetical protein
MKLILTLLILITTTVSAQHYKVDKTVMVQYDCSTNKWCSEVVENDAKFNLNISGYYITIFGRYKSQYELIEKVSPNNYKAVESFFGGFCTIVINNDCITVCKEFDGIKYYMLYFIKKNQPRINK